MRICLSWLAALLILAAPANSQGVGINTTTPHASAALDIASTTQGILLPRLTQAQRLAIVSPAAGLVVYETTSNSCWYRDALAWQQLTSANNVWKLNGNSGITDTSVNFIGTTDGQALAFKVNNSRAGYVDWDVFKANTAFGYQALRDNNTPSTNNTSVGSQSMIQHKFGDYNTAIGVQAMAIPINGIGNTAAGYQSLFLNSNGEGLYNTAIGYLADIANTGVIYSTVIGAGAMVDCSHCMALGGADDTYQTRVGIGTIHPVSDFHVVQRNDFGGNVSRGIRLQRSSGTFWRMYLDQGSLLTFEYNDAGAGSWGWISTTGTFVSGSDARSKKNIQSAGNVLDKLMQLQPKRYLFNTQTESDQYSYGFLAQDVKQIFPELVSEKENGWLGIAYGNMSVVAVKAIQEQQQEIVVLKQTIDELKKSIELLAKKIRKDF